MDLTERGGNACRCHRGPSLPVCWHPCKLRDVKLATFNINGLRSRLDNLLAWLAETSPDVVCLQEIKLHSKQFPLAELKGHGLRIDHMLVSASLQERVIDAGVDRYTRGLDGASDHAPMWITLRE